MNSPNGVEHHNIGNWHWTEKSFNDWALPRLKELLTFASKAEAFDVEVSVDEVKGEAFKYVRKNKVHLSYDYTCKLRFKLSQPGCDLVEGHVAFEPFVDEDMDEWDFELKVANAQLLGAERLAAVKEAVGKSLFYPRITTFIQEFEQKE